MNTWWKRTQDQLKALKSLQIKIFGNHEKKTTGESYLLDEYLGKKQFLINNCCKYLFGTNLHIFMFSGIV